MRTAFNIFKILINIILINITNIYLYICIYTSHIGLNDNTAEYTICFWSRRWNHPRKKYIWHYSTTRCLKLIVGYSLFVTNGNVETSTRSIQFYLTFHVYSCAFVLRFLVFLFLEKSQRNFLSCSLKIKMSYIIFIYHIYICIQYTYTYVYSKIRI